VNNRSRQYRSRAVPGTGQVDLQAGAEIEQAYQLAE